MIAVALCPQFKINEISRNLPVAVQTERTNQKRCFRFIDSKFPEQQVLDRWRRFVIKTVYQSSRVVVPILIDEPALIGPFQAIVAAVPFCERAIEKSKVDDLQEELKRHCPDGIDIYFENVGGEHLEAAISLMNTFGRIPLCGMISQYNDTEPRRGPNNIISAVGNRLKLQGFIVSDFPDRVPDFYRDMRQWISEGKIKWEETIVNGLERAPEAFISLFKGENMGKMIVKVGPDPAA